MGDLVQGSFPRRGAPTWDQQQRLWWLLWSRCPGLGWQRLRALEACCGGLARAWDASADELAAVPGQGDGQAAGAGAQVGPADFGAACWPQGQGQVHQKFRFLPGNQHPGRHGQFQVAPGAAAHQVLQGLVADEVAAPEGFQQLE